MPTIGQKSFSSGEVSPALYARADTVKYATGLRACRNMIVQRHGGVRNRPGTQFVTEVKTSANAVRLIPFVFNDEQSYVLEFGNGYIRFIRDGSPIRLTAKNITGATKADPVVITSSSHGFSNGDRVYINGVEGMVELNNRTFIVSSSATNTFELHDLDGNDVDGSGYATYVSGGTAAEVYEISSPYGTSDISSLKFAQSADVLTITHPDYAVRNLSRSSDTSWSLNSMTEASSVSAPTSGALVAPTTGSENVYYRVVTVNKTTGEFSEPFDIEYDPTTTQVAVPSASNPLPVSWKCVGSAVDTFNDAVIFNTNFEFNLYKYDSELGLYGLVAVVSNVATRATSGGGPLNAVEYFDEGYEVDSSKTAPIVETKISSSDNYPSCVAYIQQRRIFGNTNNNPEGVFGSRTGSYTNFGFKSSPIQSNDPIEFTMAGQKVNAVRHILNLRQPVVMTQAGEHVLEGDEAGALTPSQINPRQHSYYGCNDIRPLIIGASAIFVQARGSIVRDLGYDINIDGYQGNDLTIFSSHLFTNRTIADWDYAQEPNSNVWAARSDGTLLGLTYVREQQVLGWHRHDFQDGVVENVCSVPESTEDAVYLVIKRTINGSTRRFIERFRPRDFDNIKDGVFMDASFTYDGRNTNTSHTMTLSGGTDWDYTETLTLTSSTSYFDSGEVGNAIHLTGSDGTIIRCEITAYTSATVVSVKADKTVPSGMRSTAISDWARAVDELAGLWDLEGEDVSVFADGYVVASPDNSAYTTVTVSGGKIALDDTYTVIHVGLPFVSDMETLDIEVASDGTLMNVDKRVTQVTAYVQESRGIFVGPSEPSGDTLDGLVELKIREDEDYDDPVRLVTDKVSINIVPEWNSNGRVFIRQVDPLPLSILSIAPSGDISEGGA